jgi:hypothetical protein
MGNHSAPPERPDPPSLSQLVVLLVIGALVFAVVSSQFTITTQSPRYVTYTEIKDMIRQD